MKNNPITGFGYALSGLRILFRPGLRRFVVVPLLVNILVFSLLVWGGIELFDRFIDWLLPQDSWVAHLSWILWPLFALSALLIVFYAFTAVGNLVAAPFNGLLAEKVETALTGSPVDQDSGWNQIVRDIVPSVLSEVRKILYFLVRAIPLLLLFLIPGVNLVAPFLWLAFSAWYLALEYADFPMGNHGIRFREQHKRLKGLRFNAFGLGAGLLLLMAIPGVNFLAMPAGVAGATLLWSRELATAEN